jgi:hypothetical protein
MCRENWNLKGSSGGGSGWTLPAIGGMILTAVIIRTAAAHAAVIEAALVWFLIRLVIAAGFVVGFMLTVILFTAATKAGYTWRALRGVFRAAVWSGRALFRASIWSGRHLYRLICWCVWRIRLASWRRRLRRRALYEARTQASLNDVPEEVHVPVVLALPAPRKTVTGGRTGCGCGCSRCWNTEPEPEHCRGPHCDRAARPTRSIDVVKP